MVSRASREPWRDIFPGMTCSDLVFGGNGEVTGVIAGEFGLDKDGE